MDNFIGIEHQHKWLHRSDRSLADCPLQRAGPSAVQKFDTARAGGVWFSQQRHGRVPAVELIASDENWPYTIYKSALTKPWVVYMQKASPAWPAA